MQRTSTMSVVVRANGASEAFYNGQRDRVVETIRAEAAERIRQAKREIEIERDRADANARNCSRFRAEKLASMRRHKSAFRRFIDKVAVVYALICAFAVDRVWVDMLINLLERMKKQC